MSSVLSSRLLRVPFILRRATGRGPLNSNNPARRPSIFHFIKGAAALLLRRNDSTDLPPSLPIGSAAQPFWPTIKPNIRCARNTRELFISREPGRFFRVCASRGWGGRSLHEHRRASCFTLHTGLFKIYISGSFRQLRGGGLSRKKSNERPAY